MTFVDWRRLAIAAPLLAGAALLVFVLTRDDADRADTPRAQLVDTPPGATADIGVQNGELARDFAVRSPGGTPSRLSELRGRPTIINFWATWCTSCLAELPDFKAVQQEIGANNLNVLAVNAGETGADAQEFLDELQADAFHVGMDPTLLVADAYGVFGLPTTIFLDADGIVRGVYTGHLAKDDMRAFIEAASAGDTAQEPEPKIRLVTTVARDHVLEVRAAGNGTAEFRSKSLRCDDSYCAEDAIRAIEAILGVSGIERHTGEDPPRIVVAFDTSALSLDDLAMRAAGALNALGDPLYERPLEIQRR
jgi:thiol-disulfide isomerase/thioredoxin